MLPGLILKYLVEANFKYFIAALLIEGKFRPIRVSHKHIRWLEVEIKARLKAAWLEGNVREDGSWKSVSVEIDYL